jgi:glycosyltransferase involved in cell wall biosynthesis
MSDAQAPIAEEHYAEYYDARRLVVDVTAVSGQTLFTGVQRIVRGFAETNVADIVLVRFDQKTRVFRIVPRISRIRYRGDHGFLGRLRERLKALYWSMSKEFREQGTKRSWIPRPVRNLARWFYDSFLSDSHLEREGSLQRRPRWIPKPHQTFLLLDIPVAPLHVEALNSLAETGEVRFVAYLHDLMPLSHKHLFPPRFHPGVRARHLRYLDVIGSVNAVVCNSEFTRTQYLRFTALLEESPDQEVRVVYPPWPQFARRTDGSTESVADAFGDATLRVLAVGALDVRKNMRVLLDALRVMLSRGEPVHLVVVSGGTASVDPEFNAGMISLTDEERSHLTILRAVSDDRLVELYDGATVVAVPSRAEGFGLPVVESISRGKPVVASDATALPELATLLPVRLAPPADADAWADALAAASREGIPADLARQEAFPADWHDFRQRVVGV